MIKHIFLPFVLFFLSINTGTSQTSAWEIRKQEDGITVYTRSVEGFDINELKAEMTIDAPIDKIVSILLDIPNYPKWAYSYSEAKILKREGDMSIIYIVMDIPWPMADRDNVVKMVKFEKGDTVTIKSKSIPDYIEIKDNITRIPYHAGSWTLIKKGEKTEAILKTHALPGGEAPDWIINMFLTDGPYESLKALSERAKKK